MTTWELACQLSLELACGENDIQEVHRQLLVFLTIHYATGATEPRPCVLCGNWYGPDESSWTRADGQGIRIDAHRGTSVCNRDGCIAEAHRLHDLYPDGLLSPPPRPLVARNRAEGGRSGKQRGFTS